MHFQCRVNCAQVMSAGACDVAWEGADEHDRLCGKEIAAPSAEMLLHNSEQCARVGAWLLIIQLACDS